MKTKILDTTKALSNMELKQIITEAIQGAIQKREKATLTIDECAKYSGIGRDKLLELAHGSSKFPSFKIGKKFLINKSLFDEWLKNISLEKKVI